MKLKSIELPFRTKKKILALGSQRKNTICFITGRRAVLSSVYGDLDNPEDLEAFQKTAAYFLKKKPKIIAYDLHPGYQATQYALQLSPVSYALSAIQHHHAHIASCMAENGLTNQKVIGVAFDGTGLGIDNKIWGAEFFICDYKNFTRSAHLKEIPLLGGEQAIKEPFRLAVAWLYAIYKDKFLDLKGVELVKKINKKDWLVLKKLYLSGFNSPLASSMGRLFDAAASLILGEKNAGFEAELAIRLEKLAISFQHSAVSYKFKIINIKNEYIIDPGPMFKEIVADLKCAVLPEKIVYSFHLTVAEMIRKICLILRKKHRINKIVLSGGVFQNNLLLGLSLDLLYKERFNVFQHCQLSSNDSAISLGQAVIAANPTA